ncbi:hypothetical protein DFA_03276 [Cavenderia fasciculata]|uniref:Argonaut-like protein n=1 Tax=Cavenderia fasciculata TaxID=261658 RepID=F4PH46_CACFS|nr:uncharacterized protein DFA_03276 [Cavenderia fasciculata]EGG25030.1 hypothetical protein DFA_03276 [Cavenderia fasciculata]|eukprot:XP_004362881.1 hypothetical protein DFA_03276 [Cavenderia fasciculata]
MTKSQQKKQWGNHTTYMDTNIQIKRPSEEELQYEVKRKRDGEDGGYSHPPAHHAPHPPHSAHSSYYGAHDPYNRPPPPPQQHYDARSSPPSYAHPPPPTPVGDYRSSQPPPPHPVGDYRSSQPPPSYGAPGAAYDDPHRRYDQSGAPPPPPSSASPPHHYHDLRSSQPPPPRYDQHPQTYAPPPADYRSSQAPPPADYRSSSAPPPADYRSSQAPPHQSGYPPHDPYYGHPPPPASHDPYYGSSHHGSSYYGAPPPSSPYGSHYAPPPPSSYSPYSHAPPPPSPYHGYSHAPPPPSPYSSYDRYAPPPPAAASPYGHPPPASHDPYYGSQYAPPPPPQSNGAPPPPQTNGAPPPPSSYGAPPPPSQHYDNRGSPPSHGDPYYPPSSSSSTPGTAPPPPSYDRYGPPPPSQSDQQPPPHHNGYHQQQPQPQQHQPQGPPPPLSSSTDSRPPPLNQSGPSQEELDHQQRSKMREELRAEKFPEGRGGYSSSSSTSTSHYESRTSSTRESPSHSSIPPSSVANNTIILGAKKSSSSSSFSSTSSSSMGSSSRESMGSSLGGGYDTDEKNKKFEDRRQIVKLSTNYFQCKINSMVVHMYNVEFTPTLDSRDMRIRTLREFEASLGPFQFDGSSIMIGVKKQPSTSFISETNHTTVKVNYIKELRENDPTLIQLYNVFLKKLMTMMDYSIMGRQYYSSKLKRRIEGADLEVWPGFFTAISQNERGLSLVADISHKIVRTESVWDFITKCLNKRMRESAIEDELKGKIIVTKYNNKTYRVDTIDWNMNPRNEFETATGKITFQSYYQQHYPNHKINSLSQPLVTSLVKRKGTKETIYLVPELCFITGMSEDLTSNYKLMSELSKIVHVNASDRDKKLREFVRSLKTNPLVESESKKWGITFANAMEVDGRVMNVPRNIRNNDPIRGTWVLIANSQDKGPIPQFINDLCNFTKLPPPKEIYLNNPRPEHYSSEIGRYIESQGKPLFFFCIIPQKNDFYNHIKRATLINHKVITQCALARTVGRGKSQIVSKITNQLRAKLGMAPWTLSVDNPVRGDSMIVGIDLGHNTDQRGKSVVGICATLNAQHTLFYSTAILQSQAGKDIIESLKPSMESSLKAYYNQNKKLPQTMIIYRDGVGDGMLASVHKFEVSAVREAVNNMPQSMGAKPKIVYIIVKKNTNTRFFDLSNSSNNPQSGTVIYEGCVHQDWYDFYLIAQKTTVGTINPTHFHVICDESDINPPALQQLTFNLCNIYYNYDGPVRAPAVCQYAKKLSFMIGRNVHSQASEDLSLKLYYL